MDPRIAVSQVCSIGWELDRDLARYPDLGVNRIGLYHPKVERHGTDASVAGVRASELTVTSLLTDRHVTVADPGRWPEQRDDLVDALELAARMGAPALVLTTGPAGDLSWEEAAGRLVEALAPVVDAAEDLGVALAIEHTNHLRTDLSFALSFADAVVLAQRLDTSVCLEITACWLERDLGGSLRRAEDRLALVHVSDVPAGSHQTPDRVVPGDGALPLRRVLGTILDTGYDGCFELELAGPRIEEEGYETAIRRGVSALSHLVE